MLREAPINLLVVPERQVLAERVGRGRQSPIARMRSIDLVETLRRAASSRLREKRIGLLAEFTCVSLIDTTWLIAGGR